MPSPVCVWVGLQLSPGKILFPEHLLLACKDLCLGRLEKTVALKKEGKPREFRLQERGRGQRGGGCMPHLETE